MKPGRVFVVGSLHYDIVLNAPHLPARDETVIGENVQFVCGGKGGNQAVAAAQHGAVVSFAGSVGDDFFAEALLAHLKQAGVNSDRVQRHTSKASGMSVAIVEPDGDYGAVVASGVNQAIGASGIAIPDNIDCVILQNEIPQETNIDIAERARNCGARVILNAAPMRPLSIDLLNNVDVLVVNRVEAAEALQKTFNDAADVKTALHRHEFPCPVVIVTLGRDGLVFCEGDGPPCHMPAVPVKVVSSHGAGDAFVGALASQLAIGKPLDEALTYASTAAALHVSAAVELRSHIGPANVNELVHGTGAS